VSAGISTAEVSLLLHHQEIGVDGTSRSLQAHGGFLRSRYGEPEITSLKQFFHPFFQSKTNLPSGKNAPPGGCPKKEMGQAEGHQTENHTVVGGYIVPTKKAVAEKSLWGDRGGCDFPAKRVGGKI